MTQGAKDPNRKHYFSILKKDEMPRFQDDLYKYGNDILIWKQGNEKSAEDFKLESIEGDIEKPILKLSQQGGFLSKLTGSSLIDQDVLIKIPLGKFIFFSTSFLTYDPEDSLYTVEVKDKIFKCQQRSNYRLMVSDYIKVQFKINDRVYECNDISAGGTSFTLSEEEKNLFEKDQIYHQCELLFNKKKFLIPKVKIAGMFPNKDAGGNTLDGIKAGIAFIDIPGQVEEDLTIHINSEARAEEIQKRFRAKKKANA